MIALDTNVLIRVLIADDARQTELAERLLRQAADAGEPCFLSDPVLCETEWVLDSLYKVPRSEIAAAVESLLARKDLFSFEDADVVRKALASYRRARRSSPTS